MLTNLNGKMEVTTLMSAFQIEVVAMEDIVYRVVMLLRIAEESAFDILFKFDRLDVLIETLVTTLVEMYMKHGLVSHARVVVVWKALRGIYGNNEDYEFAFEMISLYSSVMTRQWDPGKNNTLMVVTEYEHGWRNPLSIYGLLDLVYDRRKIWFKSIWVLLMLVYDRGKFWSSSIWVQLMSDLSVFNALILIHFSSKLKGLLAARRVVETISNLEDKVVFKAVALIGPMMIKA